MSEASRNSGVSWRQLVLDSIVLRLMTRRRANFAIDLLRVWDVAAVLLSGYLTGLLLMHFGSGGRPGLIRKDVMFFAISMPFCLSYAGTYALMRLGVPMRNFLALTRGVALAALLFAVFLTISQTAGDLNGPWTLFFLALSFALLFLPRLVIGGLLSQGVGAELIREPIAIVGAGCLADRVTGFLREECDATASIMGTFDDRNPARLAADGILAPVGTLDDLIEKARDGRIRRIILTLPPSADDRLLEIIHRLKALAIDIDLCSSHFAFSLMRRRAGHVDDLPLLKVTRAPLGDSGYAMKRIEDLVLASVALFLLSPILLAAAIAIRMTSPGPVLFRQKRYGFNNETIEVLKLRSMRIDQADQSGGLQASRGDPRVTGVGRFLRRTSIDELPQLINVLNGSMSLVGPRPHPVGMRTNDLLCEEIVDTYAHRHRVKPGITGWAQVNGLRGATDTTEHLERRVQFDLYYIENWSLYFDFKIMVLTVFKVWSGENAY